MVQKIFLITTMSGILVMTGSIAGRASFTTILSSSLIVLGGTLVSAFLAYPSRTIRELINTLYLIFKTGDPDYRSLIASIEHLARIRRVHGVKALEMEEKRIDNRFLRKGIVMIVDGYDRYTIQNALEKEYDLYFSRRESQQGILNTLVRLSPVFGFIGTIIGLIDVLNHMGSTEDIGRGMAIALMTTLYGLLFANMVFLPLSRKFSEYGKSETLMLNVILEGVMNICDEKNSLYVSHRLQSFMDTHYLADMDTRVRCPESSIRNLKTTLIRLITGQQHG